ncbi:hypothetical protein LCGC14_2576980, partial [marine sediment metagenome]
AGGGCTIATFTGTLTDYMTATGGLIATEAGLATENNGSNKVRIVSGSTWAQTPIVGTLLKIDLSAPLASGEDDAIYEITAATTTTIDIDADFAAGGADDAITCEIWVGGAYPDIATAINASTLSEDPDGTYRKRYICVNVQEVDAFSDFVAETSETALQEDDGSRKLIGFYDSLSVVQPAGSGADDGYRVVSDMDEGGTYYGGAWEAFKRDEGFPSIRPDGKWIEWNAKGNSINILELNTNNFEMRNFKIHNTAIGGTNALIHVDDAAISNTAFVNNWFAAADLLSVNDQTMQQSAIKDCYFDDSIVLKDQSTTFFVSSFVNCVSNGTGRAYIFDGTTQNFWYSCFFYKGARGIKGQGGTACIRCTFFGQTVSCIEKTVQNHRTVLINNIFSPAAVSDYAVEITTAGSVNPASANNIMYAAGVGVLTDPIFHDQITPNPPLPVGTLEVDPLFVNPADGDFRLQANSPALNGG